jgi:hypothetical protein
VFFFFKFKKKSFKKIIAESRLTTQPTSNFLKKGWRYPHTPVHDCCTLYPFSRIYGRKGVKNDGHGNFSPIISLRDEIVSKEARDFS